MIPDHEGISMINGYAEGIAISARGKQKMREYMRTTLRVWKILMFFIVLTATFYFGLTWMDRYQENFHRYDEPGGGAVKVSRQQTADGREYAESGVWNFWPRIIEFLRDGE